MSFDTKVTFVQVLKVKTLRKALGDKNNVMITGKVKYMTCDKEQCVTLEEEFEIKLN